MAAVEKRAVPAASAAVQLAGFLAKYDPSVARLARGLLAAVRRRYPTALELIYDNYQFLAIGYSSTERPSDCLFSLAVSPKGVALSFYYGADLPDPQGILLGGGKQNRFVRLESPATLSEPAVVALMAAAEARARTPLPVGKRGRSIVKSISAKQRPRR